MLRFGFDLETDVFGFYYVFWYHYNLLINGTKKMVHDCEGTKRCPVFIWVQDLSHFMCIVRKINNMRLCVKSC